MGKETEFPWCQVHREVVFPRRRQGSVPREAQGKNWTPRTAFRVALWGHLRPGMGQRFSLTGPL